VIGVAELWRAFDKTVSTWPLGGCGGCGRTADPNLTAMGIQSFFLCSVLILRDLQKSGKSENRS